MRHPGGKLKSSKPASKTCTLVTSNALDASSRSLSDIALDYIAVALLSLSATQIGLLNALQALFFTLLSVPIGIYLDRKPGAQLARLAGTLKAVTLSLLMCALALNSLHISHLLAASIIFGTCAIANENSQTRLIPLATTKTTSLASKLEAADSLTSLTLPALGGFLLTGLGASPTLALAAACSLGSALVLLAFPTSPTPAGPPNQEPEPGQAIQLSQLSIFLKDAREGWAELWGAPTLVKITLTSIFINFGLAMFSTMDTLLILKELELPAHALGFSLSAGALGGLIAATLSHKLIPDQAPIRLLKLLTPSLLLCPLLYLLALHYRSSALILLLSSSFLWGLGIVLYNILNTGISVAYTPAHALGRVIAFRRVLGMGVVPLGAVSGGLLVDHWGFVPALLTWALLCFLAVISSSSIRPDSPGRP